MTAIKKFGFTLVALFGLAFASSGIAIAAPASTFATSATTVTTQVGDEDAGVDCTRHPEHPECPEGAPQ